MNITIVGTGFVGVVSAAVYASFGNTVWGVDVDASKVEKLKKSQVPFFEPGLEELLVEQQKNNTLFFTTDYHEAVKDADICIIAVGTPSAADGSADLKYVFAASQSLAEHIKPNCVIVVKSTVPPGTLSLVKETVAAKTNTPFTVASVPEFLREGSAVKDTLHPDRVVIGAESDAAFELLSKLHEPLKAPILRMAPESAQMAKYAANAYLATRITYANQIADLCEYTQADVQDVIRGMGADARIGNHYWYPGLGYGGSCFPKDVKELVHFAQSVNESGGLLEKVNELNEARIGKVMSRIATQINGWDGKKVAILGLTFKPHTDDLREAPSLKVVPWLIEHGAQVTGYDPKALKEAAHWLPDTLRLCSSIDEAIQDADVIVPLIEWPEIVTFKFPSVAADKMRWFIDTRNQFNPLELEEKGYQYIGIGR